MWILKLAIYLLFFPTLISAKILKNQFKPFFNNPNNNDLTFEQPHNKDIRNNTIWVLSLNSDDLDFFQLFKANENEEKVFKRIIAPAIKRYELQNSDRIKAPTTLSDEDSQSSSESEEANNIKHIKNEVSIILNKFFLIHLNDPETYMKETSKEPQLKLFFTGQYTSLILTFKHTRYQFFVHPPSPLPAWFYQDHVLPRGDDYFEIPNDVKNDFLKKLLPLLKLNLSFPI